MRNLMLTFVFCIVFISLASGAVNHLGYFEQDSCVEIPQSCTTCTFNNISKIISQNSTPVISGEFAMTRVGNEYNFSFCNTSALGEYIVTGHGDLDGTDTTFNFGFGITPSGDEPLNEAEGFTLLGIFITLTLATMFFLIVTIFIRNIPFKIFFGSMSILMLVGSFGFGVTIMQQLFATNSNLVNAYGTFFRLFIILLGGAGIGLIVFLFVMSLRAFNKSRGIID